MEPFAYHYCKVTNLPGIFRERALLPSPPLACYGLAREAVEADPGRFGFRVGRVGGRRCFHHDALPHRDDPRLLSAAVWFEGERFAVAFSRAGWCHSALSYLPPGEAEGGHAWRLTLDLGGLDVFGWRDFQARTNVPGLWRRKTGDDSRKKGDDPADWLFVLGPVPLPGQLLDLEQYHRGRWTRFEEVAERTPLRELFLVRPDPSRPRPRFRAQFVRTGQRAGGLASCFKMVLHEGGRLMADHLWVRQTWDHLRPGDVVEFFATVEPYPRQDGTASFTLGEVNGLVVCGPPPGHDEGGA